MAIKSLNPWFLLDNNNWLIDAWGLFTSNSMQIQHAWTLRWANWSLLNDRFQLWILAKWTIAFLCNCCYLLLQSDRFFPVLMVIYIDVNRSNGKSHHETLSVWHRTMIITILLSGKDSDRVRKDQRGVWKGRGYLAG